MAIADNVKSQVRKAIEKYGELVSLYKHSGMEIDTDEEGHETVTNYGTSLSIYAVPSNNQYLSRILQNQGEENGSELSLLLKDDASIVQNDIILYQTKYYRIVNIELIKLQGVLVAINVTLTLSD